MSKHRQSKTIGSLTHFFSEEPEPEPLSLESRVANLETTLRLVLSEITDIRLRLKLDKPQNTAKKKTPKESRVVLYQKGILNLLADGEIRGTKTIKAEISGKYQETKRALKHLVQDNQIEYVENRGYRKKQ